jgi:DNA-binding CsgD family transcriptional regulator
VGLNGALEERTFSEVKRLCYYGLDGPTLLREAVGRLRRVVPFEAYCASTVDSASGLITHAIAEEMGGEKEAAIFLEHLYFEYDLDQLRRMVQSRRPVVLLSEVAGGGPERSPRYREMLGPLGLGHEMRTVFVDGGSLWGTLDLSREAGRPDFQPREVALLKRLAPHLGAALKTATLRSQASTDKQSDPDVPGVLTLDHKGRVVQHTAAAEHWLKEIGELKPGWQERADLPAAVRMISCALRRALDPSPDEDLGGVPRLRVRARSGRWLALYGSLTEPTPVRPSETMIVIEPAKPEEVALFNMAAYGLSPREEEIAKLIACGTSTKHISAALHISGYTVQNHLRNIFEKVGVRSRGELLKRIFFDNLY